MHMNKMKWAVVIIAIVFAGAGFWGGMTYAASQSTSSTASRFAGAGAGTFAGRGAAGFAGAGGGTIGTVVQVGNGSFTVQLPSSTSTTASTGTKLVLVDSTTQVQELESVPVSNLQVGQTVTVAGSANSDGSVTASSVMIRPTTARGAGATTQASTSGQ
jgi:hypothetical protein